MVLAMQALKANLLALSTFVGALLLSVSQAHAQTQALQLNFKAKVNGQPFECGQSYGSVGSTKAQVTPSDFRLFLSQVELMNTSGQWQVMTLDEDQRWQINNIALLDFENASGPCRSGTTGMNASVRGSLPAGRYSAVRFTLGLPFEMNHGDPTVAYAPLSTTAMFWNWQGGYKFLKFDLSNPGFSFHLGSTACASSSRTQAPSACANPNLVRVSFAIFDPSKQTIVADIGKLLAETDVTKNTPETSPGCMSFAKDPDCVPIMKALGITYDEVAGGEQKLFHLE